MNQVMLEVLPVVSLLSSDSHMFNFIIEKNDEVAKQPHKGTERGKREESEERKEEYISVYWKLNTQSK